jgi:hypothetical protein
MVEAQEGTLEGGTMKIKELFADKKNWTKGAYARTREGKPLMDHDQVVGPDAARWCLVGAAWKCYSKKDGIMGKRVSDVLSKIFDNLPSEITQTDFNDRRGWKAVKALVEELGV